MTRLLPLLPLLFWLTWTDQDGGEIQSVQSPRWIALAWMVGGLLAIVAVISIWARTLLHTHRHSYAPLPTRGFNRALLIARIAGVAWFGFALYELGYGELIRTLLKPIESLSIRLPGIVAATAPSLVTWFGLAWAAYPIDRATREQNLLLEIDAGLTPRPPPTLAQSLSTNFRMQVLFMLAPVLAVAVLQDLVSIGFRLAEIPLGGTAEGIAFVCSSLFVFIASPELLVSVLRARPLADSPLREQLEALAAQLGLRYRDVLVWHTSFGIGNAAVMGLIPRVRYILLTDLLIESLDVEQIEAVFAHETGHVKHRHLLWYLAFWAMALLSMTAPADLLYRALRPIVDGDVLRIGIPLVALAAYVALFGLLSRLFERQADVYAARSIEALQPAYAGLPRRSPMATPVGTFGAESFVSALKRVAEISHRSISHRRIARNFIARIVDVAMNFTHPSIPDRIDHLRLLSTQPILTTRFDRKVICVMLAMLFVLLALSTWALIDQMK